MKISTSTKATQVENGLKLLDILYNVYGCDTMAEALEVLSNAKHHKNILKLLNK